MLSLRAGVADLLIVVEAQHPIGVPFTKGMVCGKVLHLGSEQEVGLLLGSPNCLGQSGGAEAVDAWQQGSHPDQEVQLYLFCAFNETLLHAVGTHAQSC